MTQFPGEDPSPAERFERDMATSGRRLGWKLPLATLVVAVIVGAMLVHIIGGVGRAPEPPLWQMLLAFAFFASLLVVLVWQLVVTLRPLPARGAVIEGERRRAGIVPAVVTGLMGVLLFVAPVAIAASEGKWLDVVAILAIPAAVALLWVIYTLDTRRRAR